MSVAVNVQIFNIGCGHSGCSSCWLRHIEWAVGEGDSEFTCMVR